MEINELTHEVIGAAIEVHSALGPGLLESAYEECLDRELTLRGIQFERQRPLPVEYKGVEVDCSYRIDFLIEDQLVIELKAVDQVQRIFEAQLLTYMRLGGWKVGLLINFNVDVLKHGVMRRVLDFKETSNDLSVSSAPLR